MARAGVVVAAIRKDLIGNAREDTPTSAGLEDTGGRGLAV